MNKKPGISNPTPAELEILRALWRQPGLTVREVLESLSARTTGYTTVLKTMQIMLDKRLVRREPFGKAHRYFSSVEEDRVQGSLVNELVDRVFGGAVHGLLMHVLAERPPDTHELNQLREMLDRLEKGDGIDGNNAGK